MKQLNKWDSTINAETKSFFETILKPFVLEQIYTLNSIIKQKSLNKFNQLWNLIQESNLACFKLLGSGRKGSWDFCYLDLETPIVFYPLLENKILLSVFKKISSITKNIRSNLLKYYNQEIEVVFIEIRTNNENEIEFIVYKMEDQKVAPLETSKREKQGSKRHVKLQKGRKRRPFGTRSKKNRLNLLTGREWIRFTKSWYIHRPPPRKKDEILHPAKFPETMIRKYITFFTKPGFLVVDPFLGTGSTLIAAKQCNRNGIGIELSPFYTKVSKERLKELGECSYSPLYQTENKGYWKVIQGNAKRLLEIWEEYNFPNADFCITSPPYWSQLDRNYLRQKQRKEKGLQTKYSYDDSDDLGNINNYQSFLNEQRKIFGYIFELLRANSYLIVITNNVFSNGRVYPLAYDTAISLTQDKDHPWVLKDEKIWLQDDKALLALGVNNAWVGNRCHQYCHVFRKE